MTVDLDAVEVEGVARNLFHATYQPTQMWRMSTSGDS